MKEYFDKKIADLKKNIDEGIVSQEDLSKQYAELMASMEFNSKVGLVDSNDLAELTNKMDDCKQLIGISDEAENVVDVDEEASKNKSGKKTAVKVAAGIGAVALAAGGIAALASSCEKQDTNEDQLQNEDQAEDTTAIDLVNNKLSTFANQCASNGIDLTNDEALMLMYASNIETKIDVGDNITLDQVVISHYIDLAEDLIANDTNYKYYSVSDVVSELMTNDYHSSLAKINDAFIKYGYIAETSKLIVNENDSKTLASFEQSLRDGISNNGNFTEANKLAKDAFDKDSTVLSGTRIIIAGQYSAINAYGQNAGVKISGMDQKAFDEIFRECGGGNVKDVEYEAYTSYMTLLRATFGMDVERQMISWEAVQATNENAEELASEKYYQISDYLTNNKVDLVTPENVNKERVESVKQQMESDNKKAQDSLNNKINNGAQLVTDNKGNQSLIIDKVTDKEKEEIKNKDKENEKPKVELDEGFTQDKDGNIKDSEGNKYDKPVIDAPILTPEEIKDKENAAADLLKPENNIVKEEFTPLEEEVVVSETVSEFIDGVMTNTQTNATKPESNNNSSIQDTIKELENMKEQLNNSVNNNANSNTNNSVNNNSPIQDEVTYELDEGWVVDDNGNITLAPGYTIDASGNVHKVNTK